MTELDEKIIDRLVTALKEIVHELGGLKLAVNALREELETQRGASPSSTSHEDS